MNLVRQLDRSRFAPEIACLKEPGPLGELLAKELPVHSNLTTGKFDLRVLPRLVSLMRTRKIDAVVTVGAGDKMFWGRIAAKLAGVPMVASALHSTGWPDGVGRLNRLLTPITDAFIGVATSHGEHLVKNERFPQEKVFVISNGVDTSRFAPLVDTAALRTEIGLPTTAPTVGILAALRPEKNHELFLAAAKRVKEQMPEARFVIIGDGDCRPALEQETARLGITDAVHFLGNRDDVPAVLAAMNVVALTSHNEANPVSILEAMSVGKPVVATDVGSVNETVNHGVTGYLVPAGNERAMADHWLSLLFDPLKAQSFGERGRQVVVEGWSLDAMVRGYEKLLGEGHSRKTGYALPVTSAKPAAEEQIEPVLQAHS